MNAQHNDRRVKDAVLRAFPDISEAEMSVFVFLRNRQGSDAGKPVTATVQEICEGTGLSRRRALYVLKSLEGSKIIARHRSKGHVTAYAILFGIGPDQQTATVQNVAPPETAGFIADTSGAKALQEAPTDRRAQQATTKAAHEDDVNKSVALIYRPVADEQIAELCNEFFPDAADLQWRLHWMEKEAGVAPYMPWGFFVQALRQFPRKP